MRGASFGLSLAPHWPVEPFAMAKTIAREREMKARSTGPPRGLGLVADSLVLAEPATEGFGVVVQPPGGIMGVDDPRDARLGPGSNLGSRLIRSVRISSVSLLTMM